jgi:ABC-2 type transport system ATP-binding protein
MIDVVNLTQHYGVRPILRDVNLRILKGQLAVVVGPNGMGKSTLLGAMAGILSPQRGHVAIDGRIRRSSVENELAIRRMTVYLPDQAWLPLNRTPREFLLAVGRLHDVPDDRMFSEIEKLLELFDLTPQTDSPLKSLSAGQSKKVALASAFLTDVPVLILDEPFSGGLDPGGILVLKRLLKRRTGEGKTIVLASPVPEIVEEIADTVVILKDGQVAAHDTIDGLRRLTGMTGNLGAILERMLFPDTLRKIDAYLGGGAP